MLVVDENGRILVSSWEVVMVMLRLELSLSGVEAMR